MKRILPLLLLPALAQASLVADGGAETLLDDGAEVVHKFTQSGTFTLYAPSTVRLLVVGGGGGGGGDCAAGGGGGGVIETNGVELAAGRYSIVVGAGGLLGSTTGIKGSNGGDSVVSRVAADGTETELFRAFGGGGGGAYSNTAGCDGGCGGGAAANGTPGKGVPGQGYDAVFDSTDGPGAGGGAGGSPRAAMAGRAGPQADGGPGRTNDITGTLEVYGPGGGAGGYNGLAGRGGDLAPDADGWIWGCGWSHKNAMSDADMVAAGLKQDGRDGYGGGGGGSSNSHHAGGNGGSGVVVLRLPNELDSTDPLLAVTSVDPSWFSVSVAVTVGFAGAGVSADEVSLALQFSADEADFGPGGAFAGTETVLDAHFLGSRTFTVPDLRPGHDYRMRLVARNDAGGEAVSDLYRIRTLAQDELRWVAPDGNPVRDGLRMQRYSSTNFRSYEEGSDNFVVMPGTITAGLSSGGGSGIYGLVYVAADGTQWKFPRGISDWYDGWMWMEEGSQYNFFANFWDGLRFHLDGEEIFRQSNYNVAAVFSANPATTGWHRVQIWFGGSGGGAGAHDGWLFNFGWNRDGATAVAGSPGTADWSMLDLDSGARLKTYRPGRDVSVAGYAPDGGDLVFSVALSAGAACALHAVWGSAYPAAAEDAGAWQCAQAVGPVGAAAQTVPFAVPATAKYVRFYAVEEDGTVCWSPTAQIDLSAVSLVDLGVVADGDTGAFSVRVGSVGTGTFSLALEIADNAAMAGARTIAIDASSPGDYTVATNVAPGATSWYRFVGTTTDGGRDETAVASFTTLAGTSFPANPAVSVDNHTVKVRMNVAPGAGAQTWTVLAGPDAESMEARAFSLAPNPDGSHTFSIPFPEWSRTWVVRIVSVNVAPGGTSWTRETDLLAAETVDSVAYTWKADVPDGCWTNPACWSVSSGDHLANGFPSNVHCSVWFPANATATIHVPAGLYPVDKLHPNADRSRIAIVGAGRDETVLGRANDGTIDSYGIVQRETFELRALTFREQDGFDGGIGRFDDWESTNAVVRIADGARALIGGNDQIVRGVGSALRVEGGSEARFSSAILKLDGAGETLLVDDSLLRVSSVRIERDCSLGPQTARFAGKGARMTVADGLFADATERPAVHDFTLLFEPASGGYTNGPVLFSASTGSSAVPLGTMRNADSTAKLRVVVDPIRMKSASAKTARGFAVAWKAGILEENVVLVPGDGYTLRFAYGWDDEANLPLGLAAPANEGDLPTGIWFTAPSKNGSMVILR